MRAVIIFRVCIYFFEKGPQLYVCACSMPISVGNLALCLTSWTKPALELGIDILSSYISILRFEFFANKKRKEHKRNIVLFQLELANLRKYIGIYIYISPQLFFYSN